eukprot:3241970-Prymnesium_polylepis.1
MSGVQGEACRAGRLETRPESLRHAPGPWARARWGRVCVREYAWMISKRATWTLFTRNHNDFRLWNMHLHIAHAQVQVQVCTIRTIRGGAFSFSLDANVPHGG